MPPTFSFTLHWFKWNNTAKKEYLNENNTHAIYMQCSAPLAQKKE